MKKTIQFLLSLIIILGSISNTSIKVNAAQRYQTSSTKTEFFYQPDNRLSSATFYLYYDEEHKESGKKRTLPNRSKGIYYRFTGGENAPSLSLDNVTHSDGTIFKKWTKESTIYSSEWQGGCAYRNKTKKEYNISSKPTGALHYSLHCPGAIIPVKTGQITLKLYN